MQLVALTEPDEAAVKAAAEEKVLPICKEAGNAVDAECPATRNETAGAIAGLTIH